MADLITSARALYNLNNLSPTSDETATIAALVTAVSKAIQKFCRRDFGSTSYDELYAGNNASALILRQCPLLSISRVAYAPTAVLRLTNTSSSNQRATVAVTSTGLTLVRVASGSITTNTSVTWAGNATLTAVAAAVNALGNGWSATVVSGSGDRASADLRAFQGAFNVAGSVVADLKLHTEELSSYELDSPRGILYRTEADDWDERGGVWSGGPNYWRVIYTAGWATVPEDVQEACAQWVAQLFWLTKRDPGLASESIPGAVSRTSLPDAPQLVQRVVKQYKLFDLGI